MDTLEALFLGIIQGLTEFLPVSSSGHIELGKALLGIEVKENLLFTVMVHAGTALSTLVIFWHEIKSLVLGLLAFQWNAATRYVLLIIISMIPAGIVGVFFEEAIETYFMGNLFMVGCMLIFTGILLLLTRSIKPTGTDELNWKQVLLIGIAQAIAVLPGISRSGSTIATALLTGVNKESAARFSFLMVLPVIGGVTLLKLKDYFSAPATESSISNLNLGIGFFAAFVAGVFACRWMIKLVKKSKLSYFAYYCFIVGLIAIFSAW